MINIRMRDRACQSKGGMATDILHPLDIRSKWKSTSTRLLPTVGALYDYDRTIVVALQMAMAMLLAIDMQLYTAVEFGENGKKWF